MDNLTVKKIVMVGAGNLAVHLSLALKNAGYQIIQVFSRTEESAKHLADKLNADWLTALSQLSDKGDLYFLALSDMALQELIGYIGGGQKFLVHTSGSIPLEILRNRSANYGVFYPVQTFTKTRAVDFSNIPLCIEANNEKNEELLFELGRKLSDRVFRINSRQRLYLHLAAVFASNFTNHMYHISSVILEKEELPPDLLIPLITETASKVRTIHPSKGQTGPAVRNDQNVIKKHLDLLSFSPEMREIYTILSRNISRYRQGRSDMSDGYV